MFPHRRRPAAAVNIRRTSTINTLKGNQEQVGVDGWRHKAQNFYAGDWISSTV